MKKTMVSFAVMAALILFACGDGGGPTGPTGPTIVPLNIYGSVTTFSVVPAFSWPTNYRDINYVVTTTSNKAVTGCFVKVKWLDAAGVQVGFTYAATDASIPQGESTITNQDYMHRNKSSRIKDSRVEYSLCAW